MSLIENAVNGVMFTLQPGHNRVRLKEDLGIDLAYEIISVETVNTCGKWVNVPATTFDVMTRFTPQPLYFTFHQGALIFSAPPPHAVGVRIAYYGTPSLLLPHVWRIPAEIKSSLTRAKHFWVARRAAIRKDLRVMRR